MFAQENDKNITKLRQQYEREVKELLAKYERKMKYLREDLELRRKVEIIEIEERKATSDSTSRDRAHTPLRPPSRLPRAAATAPPVRSRRPLAPERWQHRSRHERIDRCSRPRRTRPPPGSELAGVPRAEPPHQRVDEEAREGLRRDQELLQRYHAQQPRPDPLPQGRGVRHEEEGDLQREADVRDRAGEQEAVGATHARAQGGGEAAPRARELPEGQNVAAEREVEATRVGDAAARPHLGARGARAALSPRREGARRAPARGPAKPGGCPPPLRRVRRQERDDLYEKFESTIYDVQQKSGFKNIILERKLQVVDESLEKKEAQLSEVLAAANLDPNMLGTVSKKLDDVLDAKNSAIKDLQYELARVTKAHNDVIRVYESKLTEFGIPVEELGFRPLVTKTSTMAAGLVVQ